MGIKNIIKTYCPKPLLNISIKIYNKTRSLPRQIREAVLIKTQPSITKKSLSKARLKKGPISVTFFATFDTSWQYDQVYRLMSQDNRFNAIVLVCPIINYGRQNMIEKMEQCYNAFKARGYNVVKSYNAEDDSYVDVRKQFDPDIIFYTSPYEGLVDDRYYIKQLRDILSVYVGYGFPNTIKTNYDCNLLVHNLVWKRYVETPVNVEIARHYARNKGINAVYTGYCGIDGLIKKDRIYKDVWKIKDKNLKRIIWAPHHTITDYAFVNYSTFLNYYDFMFEMAEKYRDKIQICFKPHPILKNRLEIEWGEERTNDYYEKWDNLANGMLCNAEYEDLFMTSDAIIHDSGSFIAEYLYTKNPSMYLSKGIPFEKQYNKIALKCLDNYYIGHNEKDIEAFILNVIEGVDPKKEKREKFVDNELMPPYGKLASENIVDDIVKELIPED